MSNIKKLMMTAAGGGGLNVEDVFSTYLYKGNGVSRSITNGIDLSTEGGLVWIKGREGLSPDHLLFDTERGVYKYLRTSETQVELSNTTMLTAFNTDGFDVDTNAYVNYGGTSTNFPQNFVSWTFRKAPKFFDVVTYTGTGSSTLQVPHNLGTDIGMIIIKRTDNTSNWLVWHRGTGSYDYTGLRVNSTAASAQQNPNSYQYFTSSTFRPTYVYDTDNIANGNVNGASYVAYLFAHNNGDGGFGPKADQDIIKCGRFTTNSSGFGQDVNLGWEPQWLLIKRVDSSGGGDWKLIDTMRGYPAYQDNNNATQRLEAEDTAKEATQIYGGILSGTGFKIQDNASATYIYVAIRRGPMAVPESATDVFTAAYQNSVGTSPGWTSGFPVDMSLDKNIGGGSTDDWFVGSRLTQGKYFYQIATTAEGTWDGMAYDFMDGWRDTANNGPSDFSWMWRRAPNFFDVVAYTGNGGSPQTVSHNLGVAPDMLWLKQRDGVAHWGVTTSVDYGKFLILNGTNAESSFSLVGTPTSTEFYPQSGSGLNLSGQNYIAYLFASLDGVSKVGSYTGNGSASQNIDCGFSSGARFVLIKCSNVTGSWFVFDTVRGIAAGNDSRLELNATSAEVTTADVIDPYSSGFAVTNNSIGINVSGREYIFYAIA